MRALRGWLWSVPFLLAVSTMAQDAPTVEQGRQQAEAKQFAAAIATLSAVLAAHPDDLDALRWRGHAYTGAGQYEQAFADLDRALELGAADAWTHYARAMAHYHLGRTEEAIRGYSRALAIDPQFAKAWQWRGYNKSRLGDQVGAIADLDVALTLQPDNAQVYFIRAKAYAALLDLQRAELDLWKVADADSRDADAQAQLGYLKACRGEPLPARSFLQRAVELDPQGQVEARLWLYQLAVDRGDGGEAKAQLDGVREAAAAAADGAALQWPLQLARLAAGEVELEGVLQQAAGGEIDAAELRARRCAAFLHAGLAAARAGQRDRALVLLARALGTDALDQWEWSLARLRLRRLCGDEGG